jgi:hypothetical protein
LAQRYFDQRERRKMKENINKKRVLVCVAAAILLAISLFFLGIAVSAEERDESTVYMAAEENSYDENADTKSQDTTEEILGEDIGAEVEESPLDENGSDKNILSSENIFEDIYRMLEQNADKIFSILAFVGSIIIGVGYKSGLLPLLRDAISKLKGSIDRVKEDNDTSNRENGEKIKNITTAITEINDTLTRNTEEIARIEWQFESYEEMRREREKMRLVIEGQIDMLYAIFMSSALPQYQKDEIGTKISKMKEELSCYGIKEK